MSRWDSVRDPSNPFNTTGISDEVRAMVDYLVAVEAATGLDVAVTCTTDHPSGATRHLQAGTNGQGLAIDCRRQTRGNDIHRAVFEAFRPVEHRLYELIYADPPAAKRADGSFGPYNIKAGRRVRPYAVSTHHDHVHLAVVRGVFIVYPATPTTIPEVATMFPNHRFVRIPGDAMRFYSWDPSDSSIYAWNAAPGPILSAEGQRKARAAGGIRDLAYVPGVGLSAVIGNPGAGGTWTVWNFRDLGPEDRDG